MKLLTMLFKKNKATNNELQDKISLTDQETTSEKERLEKKWATTNSFPITAHCLMMISSRMNYTQEEIELLEKMAKRHNDNVEILEGTTKAYSEERFESVLKELKNEGLIKHGYDYAWIRWLIQHNCLRVNKNLKTKSDEDFCLYLKSIGIKDVPDRSVLYRYYKLMERNKPPYTLPFTFEDCINDPQERNRRNTLIEEFMKRMMA